MTLTEFNKANFGDQIKSNRQNTEHRLGRIPRTPIDDANYTAKAKDVLITYTALTAPRTVIIDATLANVKAGKRYIVKDEAGTANTHSITIDPASSQTINGSATATINTAYGSIELYTDGSNWFTL